LNTHNSKSLEKTYPAEVVDDMTKRLEIVHTPKHGSWLNMSEIEFGCLKRAGIKKRVSTKKDLIKQVKAYEKMRNKESLN
jgi:hypothetical protein